MNLERIAPIVFALVAACALVIAPGDAAAKGQVQLHLVVIEASKAGETARPDAVAPKVFEQIKEFGYPSVRVVDSLDATVEDEASISLQISPNPGDERAKQMLKVTVIDKKADVTKLKIALPSMKFSAETEHKKGGTILVAARKTKDGALFLAVTPKP